MMTIRVKTGQNDLDVCIEALRFAFSTGVVEMRTKWFSITPSYGLRWANINFGTSVLDRVRKTSEVNNGLGLFNRVCRSAYPAGFADYIGIHSIS